MRRHGEGTLWTERRKGRPVRYVVEHQHEGIRRRQRFATLAEAKAALRGTDARVPLAATSRLSDYLASWMSAASSSLRPATRKRYGEIVRLWLVPKLGSYRLDRLTVSAVQSYLFDLPLHPRTISHHRAVLRKALNDAIRDGLLTRNVAALASAPTIPRSTAKWLSHDELADLFAATESTDYHALWVIAGTTGLRAAEMLGLRWEDIDWEAPELRVRYTLQRVDGAWVLAPPKTVESTREVPLTPYAVWALRQHHARQSVASVALGLGEPVGLVFTTPAGQPIHGPNLSKYLRRDLRAVGLPVVTVHQLRHSCASWWLAEGVDIKTVSTLLGHTDPRITMALYLHVSGDLKRDAVARMQRRMEAR